MHQVYAIASFQQNKKLYPFIFLLFLLAIEYVAIVPLSKKQPTSKRDTTTTTFIARVAKITSDS